MKAISSRGLMRVDEAVVVCLGISSPLVSRSDARNSAVRPDRRLYNNQTVGDEILYSDRGCCDPMITVDKVAGKALPPGIGVSGIVVRT